MSDVIRVGEEPPPMDAPETASPSGGSGVAVPPPKGKPTKGQAKTAGRFRAINDFLDVTARALAPTEALVWVLLWRDTRDGLARTSQSYLAQRAGVNERTARRAVERLCEAKLLTRVHKGGINRGMSIYRVHPTPREGD